MAYTVGMPVYLLESEMPWDEFQRWRLYFEARPPGWREDERAWKQMQAWGVKGDPWRFFPSLHPIYRPRKEDVNPALTLRGSSMLDRMIKAIGGASLDVLKDLP